MGAEALVALTAVGRTRQETSKLGQESQLATNAEDAFPRSEDATPITDDTFW